MKVKFREWDCIATSGYYGNGDLAIRLIDAKDGSPVCTCTVNLEGSLSPKLPRHMVYIKEWGGNEGVTKSLIDGGIVRYTGLKENVGDYGCYANVCEIVNEEMLNRIK